MGNFSFSKFSVANGQVLSTLLNLVAMASLATYRGGPVSYYWQPWLAIIDYMEKINNYVYQSHSDCHKIITLLKNNVFSAVVHKFFKKSSGLHGESLVKTKI